MLSLQVQTEQQEVPVLRQAGKGVVWDAGLDIEKNDVGRKAVRISQTGGGKMRRRAARSPLNTFDNRPHALQRERGAEEQDAATPAVVHRIPLG